MRSIKAWLFELSRLLAIDPQIDHTVVCWSFDRYKVLKNLKVRVSSNCTASPRHIAYYKDFDQPLNASGPNSLHPLNASSSICDQPLASGSICDQPLACIFSR